MARTSPLGIPPSRGVGGGGPLWSHRCSWLDLLAPASLLDARDALDLDLRWQRRWRVTCQIAGEERTWPVIEFTSGKPGGLGPVRWFAWRRDQWHRPGLEFLASTGRLHGAESLEEAGLLMALDFAGEVVDVVSQPLRLSFVTADGRRDHTPDFLVKTRVGVWLIDVRPTTLIDDGDRESFAAGAELARACGWGFVVVAGWLPHVLVTLDWLSSRRRPMADPLQLGPGLLDAAASREWTFGELAASSAFPPVARACLLHLLWHRRLGMDLRKPLGDSSLIVPRRDGP